MYLGKDNLRRLDVFGDETDGAAHIEIGLVQNDWSNQSAAIDKMLEIREMFLNEMSINYRFIDEDSDTAESAHARRTMYVHALA